MTAEIWYVHRDDEKIGPLSAAQIREHLRQGLIDPFDKISRLNSNIMQDLLDVDEIFDTSIDNNPIQDQNSGGTVVSLSGHQEEKRTTKIANPLKSKAVSVTIEDRRDANDRREAERRKTERNFQRGGGAGLALADPSVAQNFDAPKTDPTPFDGADKSTKRFFIEDAKGRILGPMSPAEILEMYQSGMLSPHVQVRKNASEVKVSIEKFIKIYAKAKASPLTLAAPQKPFVGAGNLSPAIRPDDLKSFDARAKPSSQTYLIIASVALFVLSLAILFIFGRQKPVDYSTPRKSPRTVINKSVNKNPPPPPSLKKVDSRRSKPAVKKQNPSPKPFATAKPRPKPKPKPKPVLTPQRKLPTATGGALRSVNQLAARNGQIVTVGPLRYNRSLIKNCALKCQLPMLDSSGQVLTVKFFKAAFGSRLSLRSSVYVTGRLSNGGRVLFLQSVR